MNIESYISRMVCALTLLLATRTHLEAQGTAFSYQGRLTDNGSPANGDYELQFYLRDAFLGGNPVGTTNTRSITGISNGFFAVTLDFGPNVFNGQDRWLEIGVRTNGSSDPFVPLSPRQAVTPSPYAIYSATANSASTAATASNVIANAVN